MDIDSGRVDLNHRDNQDWTLDTGLGTRISRFHIPFHNEFTTAPKVIASLCRIDAGKDANLRVSVDVKPEDVQGTGFDLLVGTWEDSKVYGVTVTWLAYME